jgi:Branched-chain amino acid aminotransferase/4-amino-4-deoxychorismate lyase
MNLLELTPRVADPGTAPSLIETMRVEPGRMLPLLGWHLARLERSCRELGYAWPGTHVIEKAVRDRTDRLEASGLWRLRLLLGPDGTTSIETSPMEPVKSALGVVLVGPRAKGAEKFLLHKTVHRPWYQEAAAWLAGHPECFDVLFWNEQGDMCEGSRSNVYMQTADGRWLTPPLEAGVLPGVQRQALLDAGLVEVAPIKREAFLQASAWRISNALRGWCTAVPLR